MSQDERDTADEALVQELDGILPGGVDRRKFLHGSLSSLGAMMVAGCTGSGGGGGGGNGSGGSGGNNSSGGGGQDSAQTVFTTPWKKEPSWGTAHVAEGKGYWEDAGVPGINARKGNGSDTEIQQIGIGNKAIGISSLVTSINFIPDTQNTKNLNVKMMGLSKGRPLVSLIWRKDKMNSRKDIAGKSVYLASGFATVSWPLYPQVTGVNPSKVQTSSGTESSGPVKLAQNEVQAIWGSVDLLPEYQAEVDAELGVTPLTAFGPFYGFPIWVNTGWFQNKENNVEFMSNVLTGYFKAMKWVLTHQEEYLTYMQNQVNSNLKTWDEEELTGQYKAFCAQAVNPEMKDKGLGYFTKDGVKFAFENAGPALLENPNALPEVSNVIDRRAWKQSEKVTFSDSEWSTVKENAGDLWEIFAQASGSSTSSSNSTSGNNSTR